jgi:hypothetical protein
MIDFNMLISDSGDERAQHTGNLYLAGRNDLALLRHAAAKFAVKKITSLDAAQGRRFWIGYIDSAWKAQWTPKEIFENAGAKLNWS